MSNPLRQEEQMSEQEPTPGQVRWHAKVETTADGTQHLADKTSEVWTGSEWVDVRALVECWNVGRDARRD